MHPSKIKVLEAEAAPTEPSPSGGYKVFNRIVDWITSDRMQLLNLTERINEIVRKSGIRDVKLFLEQVADRNEYYRHNDPEYSDCERKNADSHMRGMLMGQTLCLQVRNASVLLGTWQNIIFAEFDGPRSRSLAVQVSGV